MDEFGFGSQNVKSLLTQQNFVLHEEGEIQFIIWQQYK